ncbi:hypothetical protein ANCDUO_20093, partial [Ancylostoma duodenale]
MEFEVTLPGDSAVERQFTVTVKWAGQVSLSTLEDAMEGRVRQVPFEAVQAMDVILRHLPSLKEIILCMIRSFGKYFSSTRPVYDGKRNMYTREPLPIGREKMEFE